MTVARLMTAMVTPFCEDLEVNYDKAGELAEYLLENGSEGLVVCGTTGESPTLRPEEKLQLFQIITRRVGEKTQVWAGVGSYDTQASIELCQEAEKTGVYGIMLVTPYYNRPSQEGLYQHFKKIAEATSLPVMLYNVPSRTSANLFPATVARLAKIENIVALKEASGSMNQMTELKNILPSSFTVLAGDDSLTLPMMALGAKGVVSVASHIVGLQIKQMISCFENGQCEEARRIHNDIYPILRGLFITTNPVPVKEALNMMGMKVGPLRLPLTCLEEHERKIVKDLLPTNK
ncbi:MAG: 4-hydroxy-tetrahydrodipicolinate synthase [Bacillota bacterium]|nr:4-hydroxy-tetrahydrodipicolinate synthase [Bacillota bacterium]